MTHIKPLDAALVLLDSFLSLLPADVLHQFGLASFVAVVHEYVTRHMVFYDG